MLRYVPNLQIWKTSLPALRLNYTLPKRIYIIVNQLAFYACYDLGCREYYM
jgi:hypothetical protein